MNRIPIPRVSAHSLSLLLTIFAGIAPVAAAACDGPTGRDITNVEISSLIGRRLALGGTVQLNAAARDPQRNQLSETFTRSSSAPNVASVNRTGLVSTLAPDAPSEGRESLFTHVCSDSIHS